MSRHQIALDMGRAVFRLLHDRDNDREQAAEQVAARFNGITDDQREFVVWALLQAESLYMRVERPALPTEGHVDLDARTGHAQVGDDFNSGIGHGPCDNQVLAADPTTPTGDGNGAGLTNDDSRGRSAPLSRRRLAIMRAGPASYPVYVPSVGHRPLGDLTKHDIGMIYADRKRRRSNAEDKERGWKRIYETVTADGTLADVFDALTEKDRQFLADEFGITEWREAVA